MTVPAPPSFDPDAPLPATPAPPAHAARFPRGCAWAIGVFLVTVLLACVLLYGNRARIGAWGLDLVLQKIEERADAEAGLRPAEMEELRMLRPKLVAAVRQGTLGRGRQALQEKVLSRLEAAQADGTFSREELLGILDGVEELLEEAGWDVSQERALRDKAAREKKD
jgi:hypothetical protein